MAAWCPWAVVGCDAVTTGHPARGPAPQPLWLQGHAQALGGNHMSPLCPQRGVGVQKDLCPKGMRSHQTVDWAGLHRHVEQAWGMHQATRHVRASLGVSCVHPQPGLLGVPQGAPRPCPCPALWVQEHIICMSCLRDLTLTGPCVDPSSSHLKALAEPPPPGSHPECPRPGDPMPARMHPVSFHSIRLSAEAPAYLTERGSLQARA